MPDFFLIANPRAGSGKLARRWAADILPLIKSKIPDFDSAFTAGPGDATRLTRQALKNGSRTVVAMGGDGTLNEVVNGFFENGKALNPNASVGLIPFGSGGDFARTAGVPRDYRKAIDALIGVKAQPIDVGLVTFSDPQIPPRHFVNIASAGVVADIMLKVNPLPRGYPALWRYLYGTVRGFLAHKNVGVELIFDGKETLQVELTALVVGNGGYFGRGMRPAPKAELDDGLFDVVVLKGTRLTRFLRILPRLYRGDVPESSDMHETRRCRAVSVRLVKKDDPLWVETDGENHGHGDATFTILPGALPFRMPATLPVMQEAFTLPKVNPARFEPAG